MLVLSDNNSDSLLQFMVDGLSTESGVNAMLNVEEELRLALGHVITLLQNMVVKSVREKLKINRLVTSTLVQVRSSFLGNRNVLSWWIPPYP